MSVTTGELAWYTSASADAEHHDQEVDLDAIGSPGSASWASVSPDGRPGWGPWLWVVYNRWLDVDSGPDPTLAEGPADTEEAAKAAVAAWVRAARAQEREIEKALAVMDDDGFGCAITSTPEPPAYHEHWRPGQQLVKHSHAGGRTPHEHPAQPPGWRWPAGKAFGELSPADRRTATRHAAAQLQDELARHAQAITAIMEGNG